MKKLIVSILFACIGAAAIAAAGEESTLDGCIPSNGGGEPICVPNAVK